MRRIDLVDLLLCVSCVRWGSRRKTRSSSRSFEVGPLQRLAQRKRLQNWCTLAAPIGGPADEPAMRYAEMMTPTGLAEIAKYADGVGAHICDDP